MSDETARKAQRGLAADPGDQGARERLARGEERQRGGLSRSDLEREARRMLLAGEQSEVVAAALGLETSEDHIEPGVAVVLPGWAATDGEDGETALSDAEDAEGAAEAYVALGDWDLDVQTWWLKVQVWRPGLAVDEDEDGAYVVEARCSERMVKVAMHPDEPACEGGEHEYEEEDMSGGYREQCMICGCTRYTDPNAFDRADGESGLESIRYVNEEGELESRVTGEDDLAGLWDGYMGRQGPREWLELLADSGKDAGDAEVQAEDMLEGVRQAMDSEGRSARYMDKWAERVAGALLSYVDEVCA